MGRFLCHKGVYLFVLTIFVHVAGLFAQGKDIPPLQRKVTLVLKNGTLLDVKKAVKEQTNVEITGRFDLTAGGFTVDAHGVTVPQLLKESFTPKGYTWELRDSMVVLREPTKKDSSITSAELPLQPTTLTGLVTDTTGEALPGATVRVYGQNRGVSTNHAGRFTLPISKADTLLDISFIGYEKQRLLLSPNQRFIAVQLHFADKRLDDVFVSGMSEASERSTIGSIDHLDFTYIQSLGNDNAVTNLQGAVPNLLVEQTSGVPNSTVSVQLRGRSSFTGRAGPLYVINGIPYAGNLSTINLRPSISSQNVNGGVSPFSLQMFGPIKSIVILKDAEATAIYGARGANGVILIETFRGKPGRTTFDVDLVYGVGRVARKYNLLDTQEYLTMRKVAFRNDGLTPSNIPTDKGYSPDQTLWDPNLYSNWQKELIGKNARTTEADIAVTMGNRNLQTRIGGGFLKQTTVFSANQYYQRTNVNVVTDYSTNDMNFQFRSSMGYSYDFSQSFTGSLIGVLTPPNAPGNLGDNNELIWEPGINHPRADFLKTYSFAKRNFLFSNIVKWRPLSNVLIKTTAGLSGLATNEADQLPIASQNPWSVANREGSYTLAKRSILGYIVEPVMEYYPRFIPGDITLLIGASFQKITSKSTLFSGDGYTSDADLITMENAPHNYLNIHNRSQYVYGSLFTQIRYQSKKKYLASFTYRSDVSSRFSPLRNTGSFLSLGGAWIFSEEPLLKHNNSKLLYGKLRGSIGITGSDDIDDNQNQAVWAGNGGDNPYQGVNGISPQDPFNSRATWQLSLKKELGLDLRFFKGRLQSTFSYYHNKSYNQLLKSELPAQAGFPDMLRNTDAKVLNSGIEVEIGGDIIQRDETSLHIAANFARPRNKVLSIANADRQTSTLFQVGQPITGLNKFKSTGVSSANGLYQFVDRDGNGIYNVADYQPIGSLDPVLLAGLSIQYRWKSITLSARFDYRKQMAPSYVYSMQLSDRYLGGLTNHIVATLDYWKNPGDQATYQKPSALSSSEANSTKTMIINSSEAFTASDYLKCREMSFTYVVSEKIAKRVHCQHLSVFIRGQNLFTISPYKAGDPETANVLSLGTLTTFTGGIHLTL